MEIYNIRRYAYDNNNNCKKHYGGRRNFWEFLLKCAGAMEKITAGMTWRIREGQISNSHRGCFQPHLILKQKIDAHSWTSILGWYWGLLVYLIKSECTSIAFLLHFLFFFTSAYLFALCLDLILNQLLSYKQYFLYITILSYDPLYHIFTSTDLSQQKI